MLNFIFVVVFIIDVEVFSIVLKLSLEIAGVVDFVVDVHEVKKMLKIVRKLKNW